MAHENVFSIGWPMLFSEGGGVRLARLCEMVIRPLRAFRAMAL